MTTSATRTTDTTLGGEARRVAVVSLTRVASLAVLLLASFEAPPECLVLDFDATPVTAGAVAG